MIKLSDNEIYVMQKALAYYANNETASIGDLAASYDVAQKLERLTMTDAQIEQEVRECGEL